MSGRVVVQHSPNYSALFAMLECLDLKDELDPHLVVSITNTARKILLVGSLFGIEEVKGLSIYGGYKYYGHAQAGGWDRLEIHTKKHKVALTPQ